MTPDAAGEEPPVGRPAADDADRTGTDPLSWATGERPLVGPGGTVSPPRVRPYLARATPPAAPVPEARPALPIRGRSTGGLAVPRRRRAGDEPAARPVSAGSPDAIVTPPEGVAPLRAGGQRNAGRGGLARGYGEEQPEAAAVPRPFVLTTGRVAAEVPYIGLETQVTARSDGPPPTELAPQLTAIVTLCAEPTSVAEISARLRLHLGVARILVADLHTAGLLDVPGVDAALATDPDLIMRVMRGIRDLS